MSEQRGLYSEKIKERRRVFFYDVKVSSNGDRFLSINETITRDGQHTHSRIIVAEDELDDFMFGLNKAVEYMQRNKSPINRTEKFFKPNRYGDKWSEAEDNQLLKEFDDGLKIIEIAKEHCRSEGAIQSRLVKHGRLEPYRKNPMK